MHPDFPTREQLLEQRLTPANIATIACELTKYAGTLISEANSAPVPTTLPQQNPIDTISTHDSSSQKTET